MWRSLHLSRCTECVVGLVFLASAILKALDVQSFALQISYYGVLRDPAAVRVIALVVVGVESLIGAMLLVNSRWEVGSSAGSRGRLRTIPIVPHALAVILLIGFTGLIAYAWAFEGLEDCGCFGKFIKLSPGPSIIKNLLMLLLLVVAWGAGRGKSREEPVALAARMLRTAIIVVCAALIVALGVYETPGEPIRQSGQSSDPPRPFAQFRVEVDGQSWDLGQGEYLVAMLSTTCEHCVAMVSALNRMVETPGLPPVIGLMLGDEDTLTEFRKQAEPHFPTVLVDALKFVSFIGKVPPRLFYVRDGREVQFWDNEAPSPSDLLGIMQSR